MSDTRCGYSSTYVAPSTPAWVQAFSLLPCLVTNASTMANHMAKHCSHERDIDEMNRGRWKAAGEVLRVIHESCHDSILVHATEPNAAAGIYMTSARMLA